MGAQKRPKLANNGLQHSQWEVIRIERTIRLAQLHVGQAASTLPSLPPGTGHFVAVRSPGHTAVRAQNSSAHAEVIAVSVAACEKQRQRA